jgi:hypothetical protein
MRVLRQRLLPVLLTLGMTAMVLVPQNASAHDDETLFGGRVGYYTNVEQPFVGVELLLPISHRVYANPNVEYIFGDGRKYLTFNMDFHYDFPSHRRAFVWVGAGLGIAYVNPDGPASSNTDVGANFLAGVGLSRGPVIPYFQVKLIAKGDTEVVLAFGLRF